MEFLIMHQLIFLALCTFHICIPISAKTNFLNSICQNGRGNFTADSTFSRSLNTLLSSSVSSIPENNNGFYRFTVGQPTNERVNAIALCRGDVQPYDCVSCIKNASTTLIDLCPNRKEAIIWYDECMFRYSDRPIFHTMETKPSWFRLGGENYTTDSGTLERLLDRVRKSAAYGGSRCKYASDNEMDSSFQTVYALVQCTPDLSASDCDSCLVHIFDRTPGVGGRFLAPSCNARIENEPFNGTTTCGQHQARVPVSKGERGWKIIMNVGIITSVILLASIAGLSAFLCLYKKRNRQGRISFNIAFCRIIKHYMYKCLYKLGTIDYLPFKLGKKAGAEIVSGSSKDSNHQLLQEQNAIAADEDEEQEMHYISLSTLQIATDGFSNANKLGEGGFGSVYKGTLKDGTEIAIKRLSGTSRQGLTELRNEVTLIARLQHKNLVRLLGCCLEKNEEMLVYEYMPNKSLDLFLFDSNVSGQLNWQTRLSIINGIARGMLYLHEDSRLRIIHRDLKASNILVDHDINPKISDFGMARIFGGNQSEAKTNRVVGTYGYMAPEYAMQGLFSVKSDVYSFGVLLLEIISGKKNNSFHLLRNGETLITFAWKLWSRNEGMEIMDRLLTESCLVSEVLKCIHIGLLCVQEDPADRPTMSSVVVMLATKTITLPIPKQPAFSVDQHVPRSTQSTLSDKVCSVNQVTLSSESPR